AARVLASRGRRIDPPLGQGHLAAVDGADGLGQLALGGVAVAFAERGFGEAPVAERQIGALARRRRQTTERLAPLARAPPAPPIDPALAAALVEAPLEDPV